MGASAVAIPELVDGPGRGAAGVVYAVALLAVAAAALAARRLTPPRRPSSREAGAGRGFVRSAGSVAGEIGPSVWIPALLNFVAFGGFLAMTVYLPWLLRDWFGFTLAESGLRTLGFVAMATVVARPLGGFAADRIGPAKVLTAAFAGLGFTAIGMAWQAPDPAIAPVTVFCLAMALFAGTAAAAVYALIPRLSGTGSAGPATGVIAAAGALGGFLPPLVLAGAMSVTGEYTMAFVFLVAIAWLCGGLASLPLLNASGAGALGGFGQPAQPATAGAARSGAPGAGSPRTRGRPRLLIAGGGMAALESALAVHALAGDRVETTLIAGEPQFTFAPLAIAEAFGGSRAWRIDLTEVLAETGADVTRGMVARVDPIRRALEAADGAAAAYDALIVATGIGRRGAVPGALTFAGRGAAESVRSLLGQIGAGKVTSVAIAVPEGVAWTLPAYELALMLASFTEREQRSIDIVLVSPEQAPLEAFGPEAVATIRRLLEARRIEYRTATPVRFEEGRLEFSKSEDAVDADAVIALPRPEGMPISGLPEDEAGFIPVDESMRVRGCDRIWAAGDATDQPFKQGGIAVAQADVAARNALIELGVKLDELGVGVDGGEPGPATPATFERRLEALLLTGPPDRYRRLEADLHGTTDSSPAHPTKIADSRLTRRLERLGITTGPPPGSVAVQLRAD